jgi:transposase
MVTVGIDPHKRVHVAVAVDVRGNRIGKPLTVRNDGRLIIAQLTWFRSIADGTSVTWAVEDGRGFARRLADGLLLAGQEVVWVPSRLAAAHRKLHAATGSKSDAIDAVAAAYAVIATPDLANYFSPLRLGQVARAESAQSLDVFHHQHPVAALLKQMRPERPAAVISRMGVT